MESYKHVVQYYETDKMGITHHSNYIRWMEEARIDFLRQIGWEYKKLEEMGIISPVVSVDCKYKRPTTFSDEIFIDVKVSEYKSMKFSLHYDMKDVNGKVVCEAESVHCFVNKDGRPVRLLKENPAFHEVLSNLVSSGV